jgi:FHS family L-fucose permease-like MFS transporter
LLVALLFKVSSLPDKIQHEESATKDEIQGDSALSFPQLRLGMIAIFLYVGVEVSTASNLPEYMRVYLNTKTSEVAPYVSLFWASLMIGRWTGAVGSFNVNKGMRSVLNVLLPYLAFGIFLFSNFIGGHDLSPFPVYAAVIIVLILADYLSKGNPARQLLIFSLCGIAALFIGMLSEGMVAVYAFISVGLFCSTLWPCIFTLAIAGLGKHTNQGSGFLIMMIMGGGFISLLQGWLADDNLLSIRYSYLVGVACFAYLAWYALKVQRLLAQRGIAYDVTNSAH